MKYDAIIKRLDDLKAKITPETCYCLVKLPNGEEKETTVEEWYENRREWDWKKMTRGGNIDAVLLVLAAIDEEAAEYATEIGDNLGAARLMDEVEQYLSHYNKRPQE